MGRLPHEREGGYCCSHLDPIFPPLPETARSSAGFANETAAPRTPRPPPLRATGLRRGGREAELGASSSFPQGRGSRSHPASKLEPRRPCGQRKKHLPTHPGESPRPLISQHETLPSEHRPRPHQQPGCRRTVFALESLPQRRRHRKPAARVSGAPFRWFFAGGPSPPPAALLGSPESPRGHGRDVTRRIRVRRMASGPHPPRLCGAVSPPAGSPVPASVSPCRGVILRTPGDRCPLSPPVASTATGPTAGIRGNASSVFTGLWPRARPNLPGGFGSNSLGAT